MLAVDKSPVIIPNQDTSGGLGEFRAALESQFIDCNTPALSGRGKLGDNVCVYESVNICAWQRKCVFDLAARPSKHTLGRVWLQRANTHSHPLAAKAGFWAGVYAAGGSAVWRTLLWNLLQPFRHAGAEPSTSCLSTCEERAERSLLAFV